ncbi:hypothetical protein V2J09_007299 [Rumex salicifolius]
MRTLKDIIRTHDPTILVLVETRLSGTQADKVCKEIGFDGIVRAEAVGFKGGIWFLWRKDRVKLTVQDMFHQAVMLEVERAGEDSWVFSAIYASPQLNSRQELWDRLLGLQLDISKPWLLMGDFNETMNMAERTGDSDCMRRRCDRFSSWVNDMELLDMGYSGPQYTWFRGVDEDSRTAARLDRGLCSVEWQDYFGEASIKHLGRNQSDHCPILMDSYGFSQGNMSSHPFRFQAAWTLHDEFQEYVAQNWNHNVQLPEALANLADHLMAWNRDVFGNLFRSRDRLWRRIEGIQRSLSVAWSVGLVKLEKKLRAELDVVLEQIYLFWVQKARTVALRDGDRNTRYFHTCAVIRRKKNKIGSLQDKDGVWVDELRAQQNMCGGFGDGEILESSGCERKFRLLKLTLSRRESRSSGRPKAGIIWDCRRVLAAHLLTAGTGVY